MDEQLANALVEAQQPFSDTRFNLCRLEAVTENGRYRLQGTVLDEATLTAVLNHLRRRLPGTRWTSDGVQVLRQSRPRLMAVATNLTNWQRDPSWLGEQQSQVLNGALVEILEEDERWTFGRLEDGYLGYVYTGYLGPAEQAVEPTHVIAAPVTLLWQDPAAGVPLVGRVFAGTRVAAFERPDGFYQVHLAGGVYGYAAPGELRPLTEDIPDWARRARLIDDALPYIGVPYLWGGTTAHGIDCSGFTQLMHKLAGVAIPRDADRQFDAGRPVEPPFLAGDLLYFGSSGDNRAVSHVAISLGPQYDPDGWARIHSSRSRNGIYIDNVQDQESARTSFLGARRFL